MIQRQNSIFFRVLEQQVMGLNQKPNQKWTLNLKHLPKFTEALLNE